MSSRFNHTLRLPDEVFKVLKDLSMRDGRPQWVLITEALVSYRDKYPKMREAHPGLKRGRPSKKVTETLTTEPV